MPTRLVLESADDRSVLAETTVTSPYLLPIGEVIVTRSTPEEVHLQLARGGGAFRSDDAGERWADVPVGAIPILCWDPTLTGYRIQELPIPPPHPFSQADIDQMWADTCRLPSPVPNSVRRDGLSATGIAFEGPVNPMSVLTVVTNLATRLVRRWPIRESTTLGWRPIDLPGGREDVRGTISQLSRAGIALIDEEVLVPARSLRRRSDGIPWRLTSLAQALREVDRLVKHAASDGRITGSANVIRSLLEPIERARTITSVKTRTFTDPAPSSWPPPLRTLYELSLVFIAGVSAQGAGTERAPLCHLWALYESWVSACVLQAIEHIVGAPPLRPPEVVGVNSVGGPVWRAQWEKPMRIELWSQGEIASGSTNLGVPVTSITATLIPDCTIIFRSGDRSTITVVDAKLRRDTLTAGDAAQQASKYLWGARRSANPEQSALNEVVLVSPSQVANMYSPDLARVEGVTATPTEAGGVERVLTALLHSEAL